MQRSGIWSGRWQIAMLVLLAPILLAGLTYANYQFSLLAPGGNDFLPRYLGARSLLVDGISPYDPSVSEEAQRSIYGRLADVEAGEDVAHFVYPLPVLLFVGPFSLLPYPLARALWMTLLQVLLPVLFILGIQLSRWRPGPYFSAIILLFSVLWYFGFRAMILGQFAVLEAVFIAAGLLLIHRNRELWAGLFLALSIIKPQVTVLLLPLVLIWAFSKKRWGLIVSLGAWSIGLVATFMTVIPDWPLQWIYQVLDYPNYTYPGSPVSILAEWLPINSSLLTGFLSVSLLLFLFLTWFQAFGEEEPTFQWTAATTLVITQLIAPRTATTNFLVFVPGLMLMFGVIAGRWQSSANLILGATMLFLLVTPWVLFLATIMGDREHAVMHVPLPLLMLLALWWMRWWLIRPGSMAMIGQTA